MIDEGRFFAFNEPEDEGGDEAGDEGEEVNEHGQGAFLGTRRIGSRLRMNRTGREVRWRLGHVEVVAHNKELSISFRFRRSQKGFDVGKGLGVEDVFAAEPSFLSDTDSKMEGLQAVDAVGVGIDGAKDAFITSLAPEAPVHVHTFGGAIEFDDGISLGSGFDNGIEIDGIRLTS